MREWSTLDDLAKEANLQDARPVPQPEPLEDADASPTWGDWGKYVAGGSAGVGASLAAAGRYLSELMGSSHSAETFKDVEQGFDRANKNVRASLTPAGRKRLEAAILSGEFWEHPASSTVARLMEMSPQIIVSAVPGAILSRGMQAVAATAATGGTISAGQALQDFDAELDKATDEELQASSDVYRGLRTDKSEAEARAEFKTIMMGFKPAINFALGSVATAFGAAGAIANRGAVGAAGKSLPKRVGIGVAEGSLTEMAQEGYADVSTQTALMDAGLQKEYKPGQTAEALAMGGWLGGISSGAAGALSGGPRRAKSPVEVVQPGTVAVDEQIALHSVPDTTPATPEVQPTVPDFENLPGNQFDIPEQFRPAPEIEEDVAPQSYVVPDFAPEPLSVDTVPPEVAAASRRVRRARPLAPVEPTVELDTEPAAAQDTVVTPEVTAPPAPIQEASQRLSAGEPARTGRVLPSLNSRSIEAERLQKEAHAAAQAALPENKVPDGRSHDLERDIKREEDNEAVKPIFDEEVPLAENVVVPRTAAERSALLARLERAIKRAEDAGVKVPLHITKDTGDYLLWLREAKDMVRTLSKKGAAPAERDKHIQTFLGREIPAKGGDFSIMRKERLAEGELKKRQQQKGADDAAPAAKIVESVQSAEEKVIAREEGDVEVDITAEGRQRPTVVVKGGGFTARQDQAGKFKVETKRTVFAAKKPAITAKVAEVKARVEAAQGKKILERDEDVRIYGQRYPESDKRPMILDTERMYRFDVDGKSGRAVVEPRDGGKHIHVRWIGEGDQDGNPNSIGPARTRRILNALRNEFPNMETVGGVRSSGAKASLNNQVDMVVAVPRKVAEVKARVEAAAKETNTQPTDAQKEAGNYAKGTARVHGLDITIETPRGAERKGKAPDGKEWSVKMPDHYGYVKRTKGADGDQVDVYVGPKPDSQHVVIIDQNDLATGKFDEHKVMLGYDDAVAAMDAYEKGFSDGKGFERIGKITPMSVTDFKEWLGGDTTKPAASTESAPVESAMARSPLRGPYRDVATLAKDLRANSNHTLTAPNGEPVRALHVGRAAEVLTALRVQPGGMNAALFPFIRKKLIEAAGGTRVVFVDTDGMKALAAKGSKAAKADGSTLGYHHFDPRTNNEYIVLDILHMSSPDVMAHAVMHEVAHAATMRALINDKAAQQALTQIMQEALAANPFLAEQYGFTNVSEFVAEALSNPAFQQQLADTPISADLATALRLRTWKLQSAWDAVVATIRRMFQLPQNYHTALEAALRVSDHLIEKNTRLREAAAMEKEVAGLVESSLINIQRDVNELFSRAERQEQKGSPKFLSVRTADQLAQISDTFFSPTLGGQNPVRVWADTTEQMRVHGQRLLQKSEPLVTKLYELEKKYQGKVWSDFTSLVHDETMTNVFADRSLEDNKHLGKDALAGKWSKAQHARLSAVYAMLPEDLRAARREAMAYFTAKQNEMSLGIIKNRVLKAMGIEDDALAVRIHENRTTDADIDAVGGVHTMDLILAAKGLSKISGPYLPLMRRGDWVVRGKYKVTPPGNALREVDGAYEFDTREKAVAWAEAQELRADITSVYVDSKTGLTYGEEAGKQYRITSKDENAEQRFRVKLQDEHVEFFDSQREAEEAAAEYEKSIAKPDGAFASVEGVVKKRFEPSGRNVDLLSSRLERLVGVLENRESYKGMTPEAKAEVAKALNEVAIQYLGSTRIQSHRLPRRYVAGFSKDLVRNTHEYAQSSSGYLAKLKFAPKLEAALKEVRRQADGDFGKSTSVGRSTIANEVEQRAAANNGFEESTTYNKVVNRALTLSFLDKLFSPSYSIVNATQPILITGPVLAARHTMGRTFTEMSRAYNDISGFSVVRQGLRETVQHMLAKGKPPNFLEDIKARLSLPRERKMLDYLAERGSIELDAGLEIGALIKARDGYMGTIDSGIGYLEGMARQMPRAVEAINRSVSALAAYRLEYAKNGGNHDAAVLYAQKVVNNTQFHYSNTNAAPIFNHPVAKIGLQFKKHAQGMYFLLGQQIGLAIRGETREVKIEAMKTLAYIMTTHVALAGALGLPTEPFKWLLIGAKAVGLSAVGWEDVENWSRETATNALGKTGGEAFTKGLPRLIGIDVSSRVGLDSLLTFGEPKSDRKNDWKAFAFDTIGGAPTSLVGDWVSGFNSLVAGDLAKGIEQLVPAKFAADSIRAYRMMTEGKKNEAGRQLMEPYGPFEATARVLGFTPKREAEEGSKSAVFRAKTSDAKARRDKVINTWVNAKGADKVKAQRAVQEYNKTAPREMRIEQKDLTGALKRRQDAGVGVTTTKRTAPTWDRLEAVYNVQ